jgi:hypothetical protein
MQNNFFFVESKQAPLLRQILDQTLLLECM